MVYSLIIWIVDEMIERWFLELGLICSYPTRLPTWFDVKQKCMKGSQNFKFANLNRIVEIFIC